MSCKIVIKPILVTFKCYQFMSLMIECILLQAILWNSVFIWQHYWASISYLVSSKIKSNLSKIWLALSDKNVSQNLLTLFLPCEGGISPIIVYHVTTSVRNRVKILHSKFDRIWKFRTIFEPEYFFISLHLSKSYELERRVRFVANQFICICFST